MRIRETPMRVNKKTTAFDLLEYLGDLEEVLVKGGRIVAIPERALMEIKLEFFVIREILRSADHVREIPEIDDDLQELTIRLTKKEWRSLFLFMHHVAQMLSYFEEVGGQIPPEGLPGGPER